MPVDTRELVLSILVVGRRVGEGSMTKYTNENSYHFFIKANYARLSDFPKGLSGNNLEFITHVMFQASFL